MQLPYTIHGSSVYIKGNGIIAVYLVNGDKVSKTRQLQNGDEVLDSFHTIGDLPLNLEAKLLNELRQEGRI